MSAPLILAIDPGTEQSGVVLYRDGHVESSSVERNGAVRDIIWMTNAELLAVEMVASYGMAVGREVFETCVWIGRFREVWERRFEGTLDATPFRFVYRKDVKLHLCGSPRAKDANIRQALIDLIGPQGTKKEPGPTYGVKSHAWAALGVAVTVASKMEADVVR